MTAGRSLLSVGFVTARAMVRKGDGYWVDAGVGRVIDELARRCARIEVAMSLSPTPVGLADHRLEVPDAQIHALPFLPGVVKALPLGAECRRVMREVERKTDVTVVQVPFAAPTGLLPPRGPRVYHACADIREVVRNSNAYTGAKALPARALALGIDRLEAALVHLPRSRLLSNGSELLQRLGATRGTAVVSASLLDREVGSVERQRPRGGRARVLYVGYLRHEKGVEVLFEACRRLAPRLPQGLELTVLGAKETDDRGMTQTVQRGLESLRSVMEVEFVGPKPFGPSLFQAFADADLLALPSLSEGTPRVLVEARAFGCPVIGTRVGGIPTSVTHETDGLLIPPNDPGALEQAMERLIRDEGLRTRLIDEGFARARRTTIERMVDAMVEEIRRANPKW